MNHVRLCASLAAVLVSTSGAAASDFNQFTPLTAPVVLGSLPEATPLLLANPAWQQRSLADRTTQLGLGQPNSGAWDMIAFNSGGPEAGRYLFSVFETGPTGIQRLDRQTGLTTTIWYSPASPQPLHDTYGFDGVRWTPWNTFITGEEDWGSQPQPRGRLFELTNPTSAGLLGGTLVHHNAVARVEHEGMAFDAQRQFYFVDEDGSGRIYRYSSATPLAGASFFAGGVNAVLRVGDGSIAGATGAATWVPFTDATGAALPGAVSIVDPNGISAVDGRATTATASFLGTAFNRPEDLDIRTLGNGQQMLLFSATGSHEVYSLNLSTMQLRLFASRATLDAATGQALGDLFTGPDGIAIDADGNVYIVEDRPDGASANSIWMARDVDEDGVAETLSRWASLSTTGAEPTGLIFDPQNPNLAYLNVQHPASGVDRLLEISAVPELPPAAALLAGLICIALLSATQRRRPPDGVADRAQSLRVTS